MKKIIFILILFLCIRIVSIAQDKIFKLNGSVINCKIVEVNNANIKYLLDNNTHTNLISKAKVFKISYNGKNEFILSKPNLSYRHLKNFYSASNYTDNASNYYNLALIGVTSLILPGIGHFIVGEPFKGLLLLLSPVPFFYGLSTGIISIIIFKEIALGISLLCASLAYFIGITTYAVLNAIKIAKVKNMYHSDLRRQYLSLDNGYKNNINLANNIILKDLSMTIGPKICFAF